MALSGCAICCYKTETADEITCHLRCNHYRINPHGNKGVFISGKSTKEGVTTERNKDQNGTKKYFPGWIHLKWKTRRKIQPEMHALETRKPIILLNTLLGVALAILQIPQKLDVGQVFDSFCTSSQVTHIFIGKGIFNTTIIHPNVRTTLIATKATLTQRNSIYWECCKSEVCLPRHLLTSSTKWATNVMEKGIFSQNHYQHREKKKNAMDLAAGIDKNWSITQKRIKTKYSGSVLCCIGNAKGWWLYRL